MSRATYPQPTMCSVHPETPLVVTSFCPRCRGSVSSAKKTAAARKNGRRKRHCAGCGLSGHNFKTCPNPFEVKQ